MDEEKENSNMKIQEEFSTQKSLIWDQNTELEWAKKLIEKNNQAITDIITELEYLLFLNY